MSEKFSATLRISDLNDFIAPSQACVVSLKGLKATTTKADKVEVSASKKQLKAEPVKISLKDCLACSGCVTSAETVMLEKQSLDEFLSNIDNGKVVIVSLSPQSRASLAVHFGISPLKVFKKLTTFLKSMGVKAIFDTSCSRDLTLIEACKEFIARYRQSQSVNGEKCKSSVPMISSACPGWICYAEKQHGSYILPYISSVKSPQQMIGSIVKHHICQKLGIRSDDVYHVTIMPCYDKKLEAAREDFVFQLDSVNKTRENEAPRITEVDSVLTSGEVLELIQLKEVDFKNLEESPLDRILTNVNEEGHLFGVHGSSGGYAETIFRHAAKVLFGKEIEGPLEFKSIRNSDFQELTLEVEGKTLLKFALCYGFRNLQNVVRKIKTGKCEYHFLEIMACPSGCLNGGGQIKPKPGQSPKGLIELLEAAYEENVIIRDPFENPVVKDIYKEWVEKSGSEKAKKHMLHTEYHPVVKSITAQLHNW
ncbi:protein NAR1-like isoform X1 [Cucurbita pepo subsp. pepo]|uniref:protein NAR1-like isoform X1 n=2 Tax=Cucurbita pepo subsp. pepo TaxID=3664 RepID=UPI000C9D52BE|nr:protein NAR1-like isoform X1 [Cucurbita pepo subsp. pepo]XP_023542135.1 protein NAR1-like isoform X1 [Cucurbita pepo subsp. pepo]XP_023542136.1 protein NAR1-like isoform X1 [Cucurbita pepo subsp. pepo]